MHRSGLLGIIPLVSLAATSGLAAEPPTVHGADGTRNLVGRPGAYHQIPASDELWVEVEGPTTLRMEFVNHRSASKRAPTRLSISLDTDPQQFLRLACRPSKQKFGSGSVLPCKSIWHRLRLEAGRHRVGIKLDKTNYGASVLFLVGTHAERKLDSDDWATLDDLPLEPMLDESGELAVSGEVAVAPKPAQGEPVQGEAPPVETAEAGESMLGGALSHPLTWIAIGVAVLSAGAAIYYGFKSRSHFEAATEPGRTQLGWERQNRKGREHAIGANLLWGAAGSAFATAGVLFVLDVNADGTQDDTTPEAGKYAGGNAAWMFGLFMSF